MRIFIGENFSNEVLNAFDTLQAYAYKADLARYCILYILGGLYSDLSNRFVNPLHISNGKKLYCFREHKPLHGAFWMNQNSIIYSAPRQPEIKLAIDLVLQNVRNRDYGVSSLAPSGPVLFGRVFAALSRSNVYQIGEAINLQVEGTPNRACYVAEDGTFIATRLQGGGGKPSQLGLRGTNSYGELWSRRKAYDEDSLFFAHDHPAIATTAKRTLTGILIDRSSAKTPILLSCIDLPCGKYTVTFRFTKDMFNGMLTLDACCRGGTKVIATTDNIAPDSTGRAKLTFSLAKPVSDLDIRVHTDGNFIGQFCDLTIVRVGHLSNSAAASDGCNTIKTQVHDLMTDEIDSSGTYEEISYIHQIIGADGVYSKNIDHVSYKENIRMLRSLHENAKHICWTFSSLRDFIAAHFSAEVTVTYDRLRSDAQKSEFGRYCLLYALGGIYIDGDIRFVNSLMVPIGKTVACFRRGQVKSGVSWAVDTGLLFATPNQPEFQETIEKIIVNVEYEYDSQQPPIVGGADLLGQALAISYHAERYYGGEVVPLTRGRRMENECFLSFDGKLIAVRMDINPNLNNLATKAKYNAAALVNFS